MRRERKKAVRVLFAALCLFSLLSTLPSFAAAPEEPAATGTLQVVCLDGKGNALSGQAFHVYSATIGGGAENFDGGEAVTDWYGRATFVGIPAGYSVWVVWLDRPGGNVEREKQIVTVLGNLITTARFSEAPAAPPVRTGNLLVTVYDNSAGISYRYSLLNRETGEIAATASLTSSQTALFENVPAGEYLLAEYSPGALGDEATGRQQEVSVYPGVTSYAEFPVFGERVHDDEKGFWESCKEFFENVWDWLSDPVGRLFDVYLTNPGGGADLGFLEEDWTTWPEYSRLLSLGNRVYEIIYPFGVLVLVLAWAFGMTHAGLTLSLDPGNRYSVVRAALQLLIGMMFLSAGPSILQLIFVLLQGLRIQIAGELGTLQIHWFVLWILGFKCSITFVKIILLQCISPLYMGAFSGGEGTRRLALNCLKEYLILCFEGVYVTVFVLLADAVWVRMSIDASGSITRLIGIIVVGAAMWGSGKAVRELIK